MQPVLVDCGQLVSESLVEEIDDLVVALHGRPLSVWIEGRSMRAEASTGKAGLRKNFGISATCE
jgi:hypothetical protein